MPDFIQTPPNTENENQNCSTLKDYAEQKRNAFLSSNVYSPDNPYGATHPNALQIGGSPDDPTNYKGKGTGKAFDFTNGGSSHDIFGNPLVPNSGRLNLLNQNKYRPDKPFEPCYD